MTRTWAIKPEQLWGDTFPSELVSAIETSFLPKAKRWPSCHCVYCTWTNCGYAFRQERRWQAPTGSWRDMIDNHPTAICKELNEVWINTHKVLAHDWDKEVLL